MAVVGVKHVTKASGIEQFYLKMNLNEKYYVFLHTQTHGNVYNSDSHLKIPQFLFQHFIFIFHPLN